MYLERVMPFIRFLSGWLRGEDYEVCAARGNGCGALVVSRHGCAPAMPTPVELDYFLRNAAADPERMRRPDREAPCVCTVTVLRPRWELYILLITGASLQSWPEG
jgi:hypothetical protein